ncbi:Origin recognition complex subunit 2 [Spathaspora sp. JA1]|nr:Origin recognition complex subunit 2 [Spathaspora sp. JA1]
MVELMEGTRTASPSKNGGNIAQISLSPFRSPTPGRAGLKSPKKRTPIEYDNLARKRAMGNSRLFTRMVSAYNESDDEEEGKLAERIIKESRGENVVVDDEKNYGSDVEFEEDLTETRRMRRKTPKKMIYKEDEEEVEEEEEEEIIDIEEEGSSEEFSNSSSDGEELDISTAPSTPLRTRSKKPVTEKCIEKKANKVKAKKYPRKAGRPTKSDMVIGQVKSIFQQDDELNRSDRISSRASTSPAKEAGSKKSSSNNSFVSSVFDKTIERNLVPIISGMAEIESKENSDTKFSFEPLPLPKQDAQGNIDKEYIEKYFNGIDITKNKMGRFLDDKALFLEGSEGYFEQHSARISGVGRSLTDLAPQLDYQEFNSYIKLADSLSHDRKAVLHSLHKYLHNQWCFQLSQGFNINFYGIGSKIELINDFAQEYLGVWLKNVIPDHPIPKILVINGYNPTLKFKKMALEIAACLIPNEVQKEEGIRLPQHISETVPFIVNYMNERRKSNTGNKNGFIKPELIVIIHNLDGESFRNDKIQGYLSLLASIPELWLISSTDNINASLLWDSFKIKNFNFIWHDLTTYSCYINESSFKDVLNLGKSKKFVGNSGAKFVLRSLTDNHRNLYRVLVETQIENMKKVATTRAARNGLKGTMKFGVELKTLYDKCLDEFITSNEITFRTFLTEYIEHKMCQLVKDSAGVEIIFIPFSFEEMQKVYRQEFAAESET